MVILVGFNSSIPIYSKIVRGMRFMLAPRSQSDFLIVNFSSVQGIVNFPISFNFRGSDLKYGVTF